MRGAVGAGLHIPKSFAEFVSSSLGKSFSLVGVMTPGFLLLADISGC